MKRIQPHKCFVDYTTFNKVKLIKQYYHRYHQQRQQLFYRNHSNYHQCCLLKHFFNSQKMCFIPIRIWLLIYALILLQLFPFAISHNHPDSNSLTHSINAEQNSLIEFNNVTIVQVSRVKQWLAIALANSTIVVYKATDLSESVLQFTVNKNELSSTSQLIELLEFRLTENEKLLYCISEYCRLCQLTVYDCLHYSLEELSNSTARLVALRATVITENVLFLRGVNSKGIGLIIALKPSDTKPIATSIDSSGITNATVVGVYSTNRYTYFIGSATKIDIPFNLLTNINRRTKRTELRMIRVCNEDHSNSFKSRIDITLSCKTIGNDDYLINPLNYAKGAFFSSDNKRLFILLESIWQPLNGFLPNFATNNNDLVCEYDLSEVEALFDSTWDLCQSIENAVSFENNCIRLATNLTTDPRCFLFALGKKERFPFCQQTNDISDVCEMRTRQTFVNLIENYLPLAGRVIAITQIGTLIGMAEGIPEDSLFISQNNSIQRLNKTDKDGVVYLSINTSSTSVFPLVALHRETNSIIYGDNDKLKQLKVSCEGLYPTCKSISWDDPLNCGWCASTEGNGFTFAIKNFNICGMGNYQMQSICPPQITEVTYDKQGTYKIFGANFIGIENLRVEACDEECRIEKIENYLIQCRNENFCSILLRGKVGDFSDFTLFYDQHIDNYEASNVLSAIFKHSKKFKLLVIICVGIVVALILVIACQIYRRYVNRSKMQKTIAMEQNFSDGRFPLSQYYYHYNHHEQQHHPSLHINSKNNSAIKSNNGAFEFDVQTMTELDRSRVYIIKHIGNGYSSNVHLAKLVDDKDSEKSRRVAVKIVFSNFDIIDIMREIELISKCNHKNIVEYIGHYSDDFGKIHIVTEFMAGGDLHQFLINDKNRPTVGDAFLYILQICEGMEYLTKQHIIHRDLAARNCMLDDEYVIVKINDFGLCRTTNVDYEYISQNCAQQLPFRWTAIECFGNATKFCEKSDVWSFGVVVWEIFARNLQPYEGKDSNGVREFLKNGNRLQFECIPACPYDIYDRVILPCWHELPQHRPTFSQLRITIEHIYWEMRSDSPEHLQTEYETVCLVSLYDKAAQNFFYYLLFLQ